MAPHTNLYCWRGNGRKRTMEWWCTSDPQEWNPTPLYSPPSSTPSTAETSTNSSPSSLISSRNNRISYSSSTISTSSISTPKMSNTSYSFLIIYMIRNYSSNSTFSKPIKQKKTYNSSMKTVSIWISWVKAFSWSISCNLILILFKTLLIFKIFKLLNSFCFSSG